MTSNDAARHPTADLPALTDGIRTKLSDKQREMLRGQQPGVIAEREYARLLREFAAYQQTHRILTEGQRPPVLKWPTGEGQVDVDMARVLMLAGAQETVVRADIFSPVGVYFLTAMQRSLQALHQALVACCLIEDALSKANDDSRVVAFRGWVPIADDFSTWWNVLQTHMESAHHWLQSDSGWPMTEALRKLTQPHDADAPSIHGGDPVLVLTLLPAQELHELLNRLARLEQQAKQSEAAPCLLLAEAAAEGTLKALELRLASR